MTLPGKLTLLATASLAVALAVAVYWNATTVCADCTASHPGFDNFVRLMGEEGGIAGLLFLAGGLLGLFVERSSKVSDNG